MSYGPDVPSLRAEFPAYTITTETVPAGPRFVAVRRRPGPGPHTVVTPDPAELRAELTTGHSSAGPTPQAGPTP